MRSSMKSIPTCAIKVNLEQTVVYGHRLQRPARSLKDAAKLVAKLEEAQSKQGMGAVEHVFGSDIDYAMVIKVYGGEQSEVRYSPAECLGTQKQKIVGNPDEDLVSTSYVERQNLTMRMCMRRFTRLTNGFSTNFENHIHAIAIHYMYYNFVRIHQSLRCTPAMAAGVSRTLWSIEDIVKLLD